MSTMTTAAAPVSSVEHDIGPHGTLTLSIPFGSIEIHGVAGTIARVRDVAEHEPLLRAEPGSGTLRVELAHSPRGLHWGRPPAPQLHVEVPAAARLEIDTTSAPVRGRGLTGAQRLRSVSAEVRLEDGAGAIELTGVAGDVWIQGRAGVTMEARVRTVSGDVELRAPAWRLLEVRTMSGDVHVEGRVLAGSHRVETVSGDAAIVGTADMAVEASTLSGDVTTDLPHTTSGGLGRRAMRIGGGDARVTFKSMSGDLAILRGPSDPRPLEPGPADPDGEDARLRVLQALEAGTIDVAEATRRLAEFDHA